MSLSVYVRAFNAAATIVAGQDTGDLETKQVAGITGDLAAALYKVQSKFIKKNDLQEESRKSSGSSGSSRSKGSASKRSGPPEAGGSDAQQKLYKKLLGEIEDLDGKPDWKLKQLEKLSGKALSEAIGDLITQVKDLED